MNRAAPSRRGYLFGGVAAADGAAPGAMGVMGTFVVRLSPVIKRMHLLVVSLAFLLSRGGAVFWCCLCATRAFFFDTHKYVDLSRFVLQLFYVVVSNGRCFLWRIAKHTLARPLSILALEKMANTFKLQGKMSSPYP